MTSSPAISSTDAATTRQSSSATYVSLLLVGLFIIARLWRATDSCLWFDEIFSVHAARHSLSAMLNFVAADLIHPPLFYALLKGWIGLGGETLWWLRFFPIMLSTLSLVPFFLLARELALAGTERNVALLFLAVNGYLIKYAQEVRMYSLLLLFSLWSVYLFVRFIRDDRSGSRILLLLFFVNLLMVFTHYYGWILVLTEVAYVVLNRQKELWRFLIATFGLVLAFSPWVYLCMLRSAEGGGLSQNIGWQARPGPAEFWQLLALFHQPFYFQQSNVAPSFATLGALLGLVLVTVPIVVLFVKARTSTATTRIRSSRLLLFLATAPVAIAFALSYVLPFSIWGTRHLIACVVPYCVLGAIAIVKLNVTTARWVRITVAAALGCWLFIAGINAVVARPSRNIWCAWEDLATFTAKEGESNKKIYAFEDLVAYHLWFAGTKSSTPWSVALIKNVPGISEDPAYFLPRRSNEVVRREFDSVTDESLLLAFRDLRLDKSRPPVSQFEARGYVIERVLETSAQGHRAFLILMVRDKR